MIEYKSLPIANHTLQQLGVQSPNICTQPIAQIMKCKICGFQKQKMLKTLGHYMCDGICERCNYEDPNYWPKRYQDSGVSITIYKIDSYGKGNTTCYVADIQMSEYDRFFTACGNNKYGGQSTTSEAATLQNAVFAINGCYSAPYLDYSVVRRGVIYNGADRGLCLPAVYSGKTGILQGVWENSNSEVRGKNIRELVDEGIVTDTFCFGPPILINGIPMEDSPDASRAQRTFIGTDGTPGHLVVCVSNGRYVDGKSAGLTGHEMANLLKDYGCTFGVPLDGGGSSTMVFKGEILNPLQDGKERDWIVDFCCIDYP
jgi:exopolysaccharide biosynthesis protein